MNNPAPLIRQHSDFIIVYKPENIGFHDDNGHTGFFNQLKQQLQVTQLYPVHRLDKVTSGLLICARHAEAAAHFQELFENRQINKYYLAISDRKPRKKQGNIKGDMKPARNGNWKLTQSTDNPAITQFFSQSIMPGQRLFLLRPRTGKTHQLRVAMKSLGAPILGDPRYHPDKDRADRCYLHAFALDFVWQQQRYHCLQPPRSGSHFLTNDCQHLLKTRFSQPWSLAWPKA